MLLVKKGRGHCLRSSHPKNGEHAVTHRTAMKTISGTYHASTMDRLASNQAEWHLIKLLQGQIMYLRIRFS